MHTRRLRPWSVITLTMVVVSLAGAPVAAATPATPHRQAQTEPQAPAHQLHLPKMTTKSPSRTAHRAAGTGSSARTGQRPTESDAPASSSAVTGPALIAGGLSPELWMFPGNGSAGETQWESHSIWGDQWPFADVILFGDVDGDGLSDAVVRDPSAGNGTLRIYPNNGSTTGNPWTSHYSAGTGWNNFNKFALGDFNNDGRADLVANDPANGGSVWIYPGNGQTFPSRVYWTGGGNIMSQYMVGDVDGNGTTDLVGRWTNGTIHVYLNDDTASGIAFNGGFVVSGDWNFASTLMGDVTGDGNPDIVALDADGELWVFPHDGSTGPSDPYTAPRYKAGSGWNFADAMELADVTGDGNADVIARPAASLSLFANNGATTGNPWSPDAADLGSPWASGDIFAGADFTGDGVGDLIVRNLTTNGGTLQLYPGSGATTGTPWSETAISGGSGWNTANLLLAGDLTGDGLADVMTRDPSGALWLHANNGSTTGNFLSAATWIGTGWNTATDLSLADVNGDDTLDLVDLEKDGTLWVYLTGSSGPPTYIGDDFSDINMLFTADMYGTGHSDLITRDDSGALWVYPNSGSTSGDPWTLPRVAAGVGWDDFTDLAIVPIAHESAASE